jgi:threonine aldolase
VAESHLGQSHGRAGAQSLRLDLRSDAVTQPTAEMWQAMQQAPLGWAHVGEDPLIYELETTAAELARKESGLFVQSGSVGNLVALMSHTQRGDQVVLEESSHIAWCEEWGISYVCGVFPRLISGERGVISPEALASAISTRKLRHHPHTGLVCLENTHNLAGGAAVKPDEVTDVIELARANGSVVHVDGARIFNACIALDATLAELSEADSLVVNLNKGLSAPGGAVVLGSAAFITKCRINLRRIGGGPIHQAGLLAAAGLVGLRTMMPQLEEDNRRARLLGELLTTIPEVSLPFGDVDTNIVICDIRAAETSAEELTSRIAEAGVKALQASPTTIRFVIHRHVDDAAIEYTAEVVRSAIEASRGKMPVPFSVSA